MGGTPLTLRCPKCKVLESWRDSRRLSSRDLVKTGREKRGRASSARPNAHFVEMKHERCGHVFWTTHPSVTENKPIRLAPGA